MGALCLLVSTSVFLISLLFQSPYQAYPLVIGYIMNGIAIVAGGGKMPALVPLEVLSKVESSVKYTPFDSINPLHWLGDSILIPNMKLVARPGDILMEIALTWSQRTHIVFSAST
jgi:hypothetical protein